MDPNLKKEIQELKEKRNHSESTINSIELEKCLREFKTELYIKRDEVNQLRNELDAANSEIQNLRKAFDTTKKALDEYQFNLNLQLKKTRNNEEELLEKRESLMKIQLQHKMTVAEVDTLKENLQKTEMEKLDLTRKLDVFETKQRHNSMYHNEILKRDNHLRNFMTNIDELAVKLQAEHTEALELSKKTQLANEVLEKLKVCAEENEKLKRDKDHFEEMYIRTNAKYEKLEELMALDSNINKPNLLTKIVLNQWKLNRSYSEAQMKERDEQLDKLTNSLSEEKNTNFKLIRENEHVKEVNKKLQQDNCELKEICRANAENIRILSEQMKLLKEDQLGILSEKEENEIKDEPIEID